MADELKHPYRTLASMVETLVATPVVPSLGGRDVDVLLASIRRAHRALDAGAWTNAAPGELATAIETLAEYRDELAGIETGAEERYSFITKVLPVLAAIVAAKLGIDWAIGIAVVVVSYGYTMIHRAKQLGRVRARLDEFVDALRGSGPAKLQLPAMAVNMEVNDAARGGAQMGQATLTFGPQTKPNLPSAPDPQNALNPQPSSAPKDERTHVRAEAQAQNPGQAPVADSSPAHELPANHIERNLLKEGEGSAMKLPRPEILATAYALILATVVPVLGLVLGHWTVSTAVLVAVAAGGVATISWPRAPRVVLPPGETRREEGA